MSNMQATDLDPLVTTRSSQESTSASINAGGDPSLDTLATDLTDYVQKGHFIGGGSYGEVHRGIWSSTPPFSLHPPFNDKLPEIAIKIMRTVSVSSDDRESQKRFKILRRELRVWQSLDHENILPLIGIARLDGNPHQPSLVSLWMVNGSLKSYLKTHPHVERYPIILSIARGLCYLHNHGPNITHGDLKADNILVDNRGIPYLCDFGLSRIMEDNSIWDTSTTGRAGGTIRWTSPELLSGIQLTVSKPGDVYAFAMTCYEIMTGDVPFIEHRTDAQVMVAVVLHNIRPHFPKALTEKGLGSLWRLWNRCWCTAPEERFTMNQVIRFLEPVPHGHSTLPASWPLTNSQSRIASAGTEGIVCIWDVETEQRLLSIPAHNRFIRSLAFSPDGSKVASTSDDETVRVWNVEKGTEEMVLDTITTEGNAGPICVAFSPDGKHLVTGCKDASVCLWDADTGTKVRSLSGHGAEVWSVAYSLDGSKLASASIEQIVILWDMITGSISLRIPGYNGTAKNCVSFSPSGEQLAFAGLDNNVTIIDCATGQQIRSLSGHPESITALQYAPDGLTIASSSESFDPNVILIHDVAQGTVLQTLKGHKARVAAVVFSADGSIVVSGSADKTVRIWDTQTGSELRKMVGHESSVWSVVISSAS